MLSFVKKGCIWFAIFANNIYQLRLVVRLAQSLMFWTPTSETVLSMWSHGRKCGFFTCTPISFTVMQQTNLDLICANG